MSLDYWQLRKIFSDFWTKRGHREIPPSPLVLKEDPTTLFTSAGMQQLIPYLMGEKHPLGKKLFNIQPSLRMQDIDEVGDSCHTTFFEMMGNWSLGDYFKEEQLAWVLELLTEHIGLPKEKLYVTVFEGIPGVPRDDESAEIWKKLGIPKERIFYYGADKNWWSRAGSPDQMPPDEIGGPDSEVFYDFGLPHDKKFGDKCHPNCQCGRFLEIGNSVFIQYKKMPDGSLAELPQKNVDFGAGLERILAASANNPDLFMTGALFKIIKAIENASAKEYAAETKKPMRIIADHLKAAVFMAKEGLRPGNKLQGYIMRRLIRRTVVKMMQLAMVPLETAPNIIKQIIDFYGDMYFDKKSLPEINAIIELEISTFLKTLDRGMAEIKKIENVSGKIAFDLYQTYGFPLELTEELFKEKGQKIDRQQFYAEFEKHRQLSRSASIGMFKGGLADQSKKTIGYHTATHLIHQALFDVLGSDVRQEGSNITSDRLRFDFYSVKKPTDEDIKKIEKIVNEKIKQGLTVTAKTIPKEEALKTGAKAFFRQKYPEIVTVYFIDNYSKELCGGPHVKNTKEIGRINIIKVKKIGSNLYRLYAR